MHEYRFFKPNTGCRVKVYFFRTVSKAPVIFLFQQVLGKKRLSCCLSICFRLSKLLTKTSLYIDDIRKTFFWLFCSECNGAFNATNIKLLTKMHVWSSCWLKPQKGRWLVLKLKEKEFPLDSALTLGMAQSNHLMT